MARWFRVKEKMVPTAGKMDPLLHVGWTPTAC